MTLRSLPLERHRLQSVARRGRTLFAALLAVTAIACQTSPPARGLSNAQVAALVQAGFTQTDSGWGLNLDGRILFDTAIDTLSPSSRDTINRVTTALKSVDIDRLRVEGHTDTVGDARYNQALSLRRAEAVAREIANQGIPYGNIVRVGLGAERPIADNTTTEGRAQNRRVAIIVPAE